MADGKSGWYYFETAVHGILSGGVKMGIGDKRSAAIFLLAVFLSGSCRITNTTRAPDSPFLVVLGIAQDGGYPHPGCEKECCRPAWGNPALGKMVACLGLVDPADSCFWLVEATPDFGRQLHPLQQLAPEGSRLAGIIVTHAHIGHYTGLMYLGREAMGTRDVPVYVLPRMARFLSENGPWDQLVRLKNIKLVEIQAGSTAHLNEHFWIKPLLVPHRDEYSETAGLIIGSGSSKVLFVPDIDKWERWSLPVDSLVRETDLAFLDGTFFAASEIPGRDLSEIPHPLVQESIARFEKLPRDARARIHFIHLNHSNPLLWQRGEAAERVRKAGLHIARENEIFPLGGD